MSTAVTSSISVDLQKPNICEVVYAKQYDRLKREIAVSVYDNGTAYSLSSTDKYIVRGIKPDRTIFYYDKTDDGSSAVSVSDNVATVNLAQQTLSCPGYVKIEVCITNDAGTEILTSFAFTLKVEASAVNGPASTNYINPAIASVKNIYMDDNDHMIVELTTGELIDVGYIKGDAGSSAGFGTVTATVDANVGTPSVEVTASGPDTAKNFEFTFKNMKGEKGDQGIQGIQGEKGDTPTIDTITDAQIDALFA